MTFISTGRRMEWKVTKRKNDPLFAKGRNLVTYAVGLIESAPADTERLLGGLTIMEFLLDLQHSLTNNTPH
uniref:Uncharacterized protein n=1 Tax=Oryza meridionalis TaxID=40149 RepID=A0A0E0EKG3_9ORYZ